MIDDVTMPPEPIKRHAWQQGATISHLVLRKRLAMRITAIVFLIFSLIVQGHGRPMPGPGKG